MQISDAISLFHIFYTLIFLFYFIFLFILFLFLFSSGTRQYQSAKKVPTKNVQHIYRSGKKKEIDRFFFSRKFYNSKIACRNRRQEWLLCPCAGKAGEASLPQTLFLLTPESSPRVPECGEGTFRDTWGGFRG